MLRTIVGLVLLLLAPRLAWSGEAVGFAAGHTTTRLGIAATTVIADGTATGASIGFAIKPAALRTYIGVSAGMIPNNRRAGTLVLRAGTRSTWTVGRDSRSTLGFVAGGQFLHELPGAAYRVLDGGAGRNTLPSVTGPAIYAGPAVGWDVLQGRNNALRLEIMLAGAIGTDQPYALGELSLSVLGFDL